MALINCAECGKQISSTAKACPQCGHPASIAKPAIETVISEPVKTTVSQSPNAEKKKKKKLLFGMIAGGVICLAGIIIFFLNRGPSAVELAAKENYNRIYDSLLSVSSAQSLQDISLRSTEEVTSQAESSNKISIENHITKASVEKAFKKMTSKHLDNEERWCGSSDIILGDLNGDGLTDGLCRYGCLGKDGGNASCGNGLVAFIQNPVNRELNMWIQKEETGGSIITPKKILSDGTINAEKLSYGPNDFHNFPSIKREITLKVTNDQLEFTDERSIREAYVKKNWRNFITVSRSLFTYREAGGIWDLNIITTNSSEFTIDNVIVKVNYIKTNGALYKTEKISTGVIAPHSTTKTKAPNSDRGTSVSNPQITNVYSSEIGYIYP